MVFYHQKTIPCPRWSFYSEEWQGIKATNHKGFLPKPKSHPTMLLLTVVRLLLFIFNIADASHESPPVGKSFSYVEIVKAPVTRPQTFPWNATRVKCQHLCLFWFAESIFRLCVDKWLNPPQKHPELFLFMVLFTVFSSLQTFQSDIFWKKAKNYRGPNTACIANAGINGIVIAVG